MGVRNASVGSTTIQNVTIVTTAETVCFTSPPINLPVDSALCLIFWQLIFTIGTNTTGMVPRLRRGTTNAGIQVNVTTSMPVVGTGPQLVVGSYIDTPGIVAGQQWSITIVQNAATANGTVNDGSIIVMVL